MTSKDISVSEDSPQHARRAPTPAGQSAEAGRPAGLAGHITGLQRRVGNQAVQRLLAQRQADGLTELDDETAQRIHGARSGGKPLDPGVRDELGAALGHDLAPVRVHDDAEADALSESLSARAFTTGHDVFFRQGTYDPLSSAGRSLLAHELTHVVQQGTGRVPSGGRMTVNPPDDAFEAEAAGVARDLASAPAPTTATAATGTVQGQLEEEEAIQMALEPEDEEELER